jgi:hypothetical protein
MADWINQYQQFTQTPWSPTTLPPSEEPKFRNWLQSTQLFNSIKGDIARENNLSPDKLDTNRVLDMVLKNSDYDYRGAYKAGMKESISETDNRPHFFSATPEGKMLKDPTHPTAWKEFFMRQYRVDPDKIGLDTIDKAVNWSKSAQQIQSPFYKDPFSAPDYSIE